MYLLFALCLNAILFQTIAYPSGERECSSNNCESYENDLKYMNNLTAIETCKFCYAVMPLARYIVKENKTHHFPEIAKIFCDIFKIVDASVCNLAVNEFEVN